MLNFKRQYPLAEGNPCKHMNGEGGQGGIICRGVVVVVAFSSPARILWKVQPFIARQRFSLVVVFLFLFFAVFFFK